MISEAVGAVGAVVGAVAGAVMGRNATVDPVVEDTYWRDNYSSRPYLSSGATYDDYQPAYRYGMDSHSKYPNRSFDDIEPELSRDWGTARGKSSLEWENAKRAMPCDSDGDGR